MELHIPAYSIVALELGLMPTKTTFRAPDILQVIDVAHSASILS